MKTGPKIGSRNAPPRWMEVRCFNAMALWHRVLIRPPVLAPIIQPKNNRPCKGAPPYAP